MGRVVVAPNFIAQRVEFTSGGSYDKGTPVGALGLFARQRLPSDAVGAASVTFAGVVANSEIRVVSQSGVELAGVESCSASHVLVWPAYAPGSPYNDVTIRIVHTDYKIKEIPYTTQLGAQALPVQQERDKWFSNP